MKTLALLLLTAAGAAAKEEPAKTPIQIVREAKRFTIGKVGFAGMPSREELALRELLTQKDAAARLQGLLADAPLPARLYALFGLKKLGDPAYAAEAPKYLKSDEVVETMDGCIVHKTTAKALARKIDTGAYK